jgi:hypothetical protein
VRLVLEQELVQLAQVLKLQVQLAQEQVLV